MRYLPERMRQSLFVALQLLAAGRSRNFSQGQCFFLDCLKHGGGNCFEYFLCPIRYDYAVVHFRLRRISASACSSGIGTSPAAFACSYSRTACRSSRSSNSSRSRSYSSMLMTTAIFSPFSFFRNCVGAFMILPLAKSSAAEHERQQGTAEEALGLNTAIRLFFVGGGNFQHCQEGLLRDVDLADALHALLAFFLFFEKL